MVFPLYWKCCFHSIGNQFPTVLEMVFPKQWKFSGNSMSWIARLYGAAKTMLIPYLITTLCPLTIYTPCVGLVTRCPCRL